MFSNSGANLCCMTSPNSTPHTDAGTSFDIADTSWGYLRGGTLGRVSGAQLTFSLNIPLFMLALVLFAGSLFW